MDGHAEVYGQGLRGVAPVWTGLSAGSLTGYNSSRYGECPCEEARAVVPQVGFCEGEALDRAWSN